MTTTPDFRAQSSQLLAAIQLYTGLNPAASEMSSVEITEKLMDAMAATVAALATPPPLAPDYIDPEHHGEDRELLQVFYAACNAEGGTADEIHLRGIKAVMAAPAALATPPPEPPTEEELMALEKKLWDKYKTIPYQGDEFMYDDGFEYALCDYRSILEVRWGK